MQWEFEVRDGWEAFGPADQRELARAYSTGQKQVTLHRAAPGGGATYSYRLDLQKMTQQNLGSGRQRKLRRLPAGRSPDALDAAAGTPYFWGAAEPEPSSEAPGHIQSPREQFQGWAAGEGGEEEVVGDVEGGSSSDPELVLLSSTAPLNSQNRSSATPR